MWYRINRRERFNSRKLKMSLTNDVLDIIFYTVVDTKCDTQSQILSLGILQNL